MSVEKVKNVTALVFRALMAFGFGVVVAVVAGTVAGVSGNHDAMPWAMLAGFVFGAAGGWLRK